MRKELKNERKKLAAVYNQLLSRHALTGIYLKRIKKRASDNCDFCRKRNCR
jgi:hypothetical protein